MANAYNQEAKYWEISKGKNIRFPKKVKSHWDRKFLGPLLIIEGLINEDLNAPIQLGKSDQIVLKTLALVEFIHTIKRGDHVKMDDGILYVPLEIRELIGHHLGNDIQKVSFILSDSLDDGARVLTPERRRKVKQIIDEIKDFNERLFKVVKA